MKRKWLPTAAAALLAVSMITGCGAASTSTSSAEKTSSASEADTEAASSSSAADTESVKASADSTSSSASGTSADQAAADHVADLIDAIYVQERTDQTDEQCAEAKEAWDALTDAQKQLVSGEYADPDYFGRDTGDASADDPLNEDNIGENELLVVSFGTSFNDSRAKDIGGI